MRDRVERWLQSVWYGSARPPLLLRAAAGLYGRAVRARLERPAERPPRPVIVVGNLVAGGSGKTPVTIALAERLAEAGARVALISRGYGGRVHRDPARVDPAGAARDFGDEALELAASTGCPMWVCRHRRRALEAALADGAEAVISDDGLQHANLPRSFEICVVDGRRGFGNGALLPAGPMRQDPGRLASVDLVLVKGGGVDLPGAVDFEFEYRPLEPAHGNAAAPSPPGPVDAVAGIADPEPFFAELERRGFRVRRHALGDHRQRSAAWLQRLPGPVVTTRKDAMRLPLEGRTDAFVLPVRARLPEHAMQRVAEHVREFSP